MKSGKRSQQKKWIPANILLVGKNPYHTSSMKSFLEGSGHTVNTCNTMEEAAQLLSASNPTALLEAATGKSTLSRYDVILVNDSPVPKGQNILLDEGETSPPVFFDTLQNLAREPRDILGSIYAVDQIRMREKSTPIIILAPDPVKNNYGGVDLKKVARAYGTTACFSITEEPIEKLLEIIERTMRTRRLPVR